MSYDYQGPEFNGYLVGRGNSRDVDLNRNFPDLNALMYYYEKSNGQNHHLPLPDNWEQQVSSEVCTENNRKEIFVAHIVGIHLKNIYYINTRLHSQYSTYTRGSTPWAYRHPRSSGPV